MFVQGPSEERGKAGDQHRVPVFCIAALVCFLTSAVVAVGFMIISVISGERPLSHVPQQIVSRSVRSLNKSNFYM